MAGERERSRYRGGTMYGWSGGLNNRQTDYDLTSDELRDGVNVDILLSGKIRRRRGLEQAFADPGAHSLYSDGSRFYWATANTLKKATPDFTAQTLLTNTALAAPLSFASLNNTTYFSNEAINGAIVNGAYVPWGIAPPTAAPAVSGAALGTLYYHVTCTFVTATGEESGAPRTTAALSDDTEVLNLSAIPQPTDARVTAVRIYVSYKGDVELYRHIDLPVGVTATTIRGPFGQGQLLRTQFHAPPPAGQLIERYYGYMLVASGSVLYYTAPFTANLVDMRKGYIAFPERITMVMAVNDGFYVSADQTYFIAGFGTPGMALNPVLPYRAIERAAVHVPNSNDVVWLSERGFVLGAASANAKNMSEGKVVVENATGGCLGIVERDGDKRFIAIMADGTMPPLVSSDFLTARQAQIDEVR